MKSNLKGLAGNILYFLNFLIVFLLLFENSLVIPQWLQPLGRMHPMLLHFPIVILMLAMVLEFFRFRSAYSIQEFYQSFTSQLLLGGTILSAVTVIMGLFLAREEGYEGGTLQWHKWSGVSIVFFASVIYWSRNSAWYSARVAKTAAIITAFCIVLAGHFGATLTHGENFVLEPIMDSETPQVPLEKAMVYEHVIQPIFLDKCTSCHNPEKIKGSLLLTDAESVLKGGKTGKLFVPGKPQLSLLLQRIHLPLEDKKHMPPSGKVQLSPEEVSLLALWIKGGADFKMKLTELPLNDSLRILASARLKSANDAGDDFDFEAADESTVKKLNNDYRAVSHLARASPALAVNLFNRTAYNSKSLEELSSVKKQIVSLDLSRMPVKDSDLKIIGKFENLRRLQLNFTDITGSSLSELASLKHLKNLSLSGTRISIKSLQQLSAIKSLKDLTVWNTPIEEKDLQQFAKSNKNLRIVTGFKADESNPVKLSLPQLKNTISVFQTTLPVDLKHSIKGVKLRYTLDSTEPDSINSPEFKPGKTVITQNTAIKVKAYKEGWLSSDVLTMSFYKGTHKPDSITFLTETNARYPGNGAITLINGRSGFDGNFTSDEWVGFLENDLNAVLQFKQPVMMSSATLNVMKKPGTFIFPPATVEVWGGTDKNKLKLLNTIKVPPVAKDDNATVASFTCKFKPQSLAYLKIVATRQKVPAWHVTEKGKKPPGIFLFTDEIIVN